MFRAASKCESRRVGSGPTVSTEGETKRVSNASLLKGKSSESFEGKKNYSVISTRNDRRVRSVITHLGTGRNRGRKIAGHGTGSVSIARA